MGNLVRITFPDGKIPPLTEEQKREAELAMERPINYEDIPPLSDAQLARLRRVNGLREERVSIG